MASKLYAVIDTNVIVILRGDVIPLYVDEIIGEYQDVLSREQFFFKPENVASVINAIERFGINPGRKDAVDKEFPDPKDVVFYEVALSKKRHTVIGNKLR